MDQMPEAEFSALLLFESVELETQASAVPPLVPTELQEMLLVTVALTSMSTSLNRSLVVWGALPGRPFLDIEERAAGRHA